MRAINGFAAIETDTSEPVLQLQDLQGNIIARASLSETATKLLSTERPTDYGVPTSTKPERYSWLGGDLRPTELPSGVIAMGARSYIPQLGRFLQTDPVPGGSANAYTYTYGDPVNSSDPSGEFTYGVGEAEANFPSEANHGDTVKAEAEAKASGACPIASMCTPPGGELEDPEHIVYLLTPAKAIEWGDALCNCTVIHGAGNVIEEVANAIGLSGAGEFIEELLTSGLAESFGKEMYTCGEALKSNSLNRCAIELHTIAIFKHDTGIPSGVSIGDCYYYRKSYKGAKIGLHCPNGKYYKRGKY